MDDYRLRILCVELQISIVNVDYRLAPEHMYPTAWHDAYAATKWVVENQCLLSASIHKGFLVAGFSAGANLAAAVVAMAQDDPSFTTAPITGHLLQCPLLLHPELSTGKYESELLSMEQNANAPSLTRDEIVSLARDVEIPPAEKRFSVVLRDSFHGFPPLYVQVAGWDPLRDEALLYAKLLSEAGVETKVDTYSGVPHGFNFDYPQLKASARYEADYENGLRWLLSL